MEYGRLASLQDRHQKLHQRIDALEAEKAPDKYVTPLKIKRLALKDEITKLKNN